MPVVRFRAREHDVEIPCPEGANLRMVLLRARLPLYTKVARALHCRGHGTCGTCAVHAAGDLSALTPAEVRRLRMPPFSLADPEAASDDEAGGLRLACQCSVRGDVTVTKRDGLFGQGSDPV